MVLPCKHEERVTKQVQPTIDLLTELDTLHPDVLLQHAIQPDDYKGGTGFSFGYREHSWHIHCIFDYRT